jgi:hypothetical protein
MVKSKRIKEQTIVYKTLYRKLLIEQYTNTNKKYYCLFFYPFTFDHCVVCPSFCGSPQFRPHFYWCSYIAQSVVFCRVFCILLIAILVFYFWWFHCWHKWVSYFSQCLYYCCLQNVWKYQREIIRKKKKKN